MEHSHLSFRVWYLAILFMTATKKGISAWEAAGTIHSDIQKGFIRAEIINFNDFIQAGGESQAKQAGKMRLEPKDYIMQDTDLVNFRFNK